MVFEKKGNKRNFADCVKLVDHDTRQASALSIQTLKRVSPYAFEA